MTLNMVLQTINETIEFLVSYDVRDDDNLIKFSDKSAALTFLHRVANQIRDLSVLRTILGKEGNGINVYQLNDHQMLEVLAIRLLYGRIRVRRTPKLRTLSTTGVEPEPPQYMTPQEVEQLEKTRLKTISRMNIAPENIGGSESQEEESFIGDKTDEVAKVADKTSAIEETSTVFRVQGGTHPNPNKRSKFLIAIDESNTPVINKSERLNISIGNDSHVEYFLTQRPGGEVVSFKIPKWMDDFIEESSLPQLKAKTNPLYDKATTPLKNDPTTPGCSVELPPIWAEWLEEVAIPGSGKVIKTN
jgi:hypothetical protein